MAEISYELDSTETPPPTWSTSGHFSDGQTTMASLLAGPVVEVLLASRRGDVAHFALAAGVADRVAREIAACLADRNRYPLPTELLMPGRLLKNSNPNVFFAAADEPSVGVGSYAADPERVWLSIRSRRASLDISMQPGVARRLWECLTLAAEGNPF